MKKYLIGLLMLSVITVTTAQMVQARGPRGDIGTQKANIIKGPNARSQNNEINTNEESDIRGNKHPYARENRSAENEINTGTNRRLEGKEKAIERRLEGKEKAIEQRLERKENAIENRSENTEERMYRGHGRHRRNADGSNYGQRHSNRGNNTESSETTTQE